MIPLKGLTRALCSICLRRPVCWSCTVQASALTRSRVCFVWSISPIRRCLAPFLKRSATSLTVSAYREDESRQPRGLPASLRSCEKIACSWLRFCRVLNNPMFVLGFAPDLNSMRVAQLLGVRGLVTAFTYNALTLESGDKSPHSKELIID